jgi:hypothetical protein
MRLVIPLVTRDVGVEGIVKIFENSSPELRLRETWAAKQMAPYVVQWAIACIEICKAQGA